MLRTTFFLSLLTLLFLFIGNEFFRLLVLLKNLKRLREFKG